MLLLFKRRDWFTLDRLTVWLLRNGTCFGLSKRGGDRPQLRVLGAAAHNATSSGSLRATGKIDSGSTDFD